MEHIYYIAEDTNKYLSKYSDAQLLPGSIKNIYNNEKSPSYSNTHAASNMNNQLIPANWNSVKNKYGPLKYPTIYPPESPPLTPSLDYCTRNVEYLWIPRQRYPHYPLSCPCCTDYAPSNNGNNENVKCNKPIQNDNEIKIRQVYNLHSSKARIIIARYKCPDGHSIQSSNLTDLRDAGLPLHCLSECPVVFENNSCYSTDLVE